MTAFLLHSHQWLRKASRPSKAYPIITHGLERLKKAQ
nr:MAG TPA: hypothetical protein [Caudoviricetes sp.]